MQGFWSRLTGNPRVALGLLWLVFLVVIAAGAPLIAPGSPFAIVSKPFEPPFGEFLFGTDSLGRSLFAGLVHGARTSLLIAIVATLVVSALITPGDVVTAQIVLGLPLIVLYLLSVVVAFIVERARMRREREQEAA